MGDSAGETVACHYCGTDVDVPTDWSRFEAFTTHFEAEHIRNRSTVPRKPTGGSPARAASSEPGGARDAGD